uniref:Transcription initiation factor TFIID subunit 8 n=1 Tax=Hirondellea gigas TaxID=1518452 RepID=A0A2P2HXA2_9CRUS
MASVVLGGSVGSTSNMSITGSNTSPLAAATSSGSSSTGITVCSEAASARRRTLCVVVACVLQEAGCITVEKAVLGTLVEMLQSTIVELGRTARGYSDVACRSEPLLADIILTFADMGINYDGLQAYSRRPNRNIVPPLQVQQDTKQHTILQVGDKKPHLPYIPDNLPPFPDTHTYCFTPTVKQPVTEYEAIREKAATQKRDIERALTKFATKTNPIESVFIAEDKEFALVSVAPSSSQNIDALMPRDQVFEAELDYEVSKARKKRQDRLSNLHQQQQQLKQEQGEQEQETKVNESAESDVMDNPYLRPVKMPRKTGGRNKHHRSNHKVHNPSSSISSTKESTLGPNINRIVLGGSVNKDITSNVDSSGNIDKSRQLTDPISLGNNDRPPMSYDEDLEMREIDNIDMGDNGNNRNSDDTIAAGSSYLQPLDNSPRARDGGNGHEFYDENLDRNERRSSNYEPDAASDAMRKLDMSTSRRDVGAATRGLEEAGMGMNTLRGNFSPSDTLPQHDENASLMEQDTMSQLDNSMAPQYDDNNEPFHDHGGDTSMLHQRNSTHGSHHADTSMMHHVGNHESFYDETEIASEEQNIGSVPGEMPSYIDNDNDAVISPERMERMHSFSPPSHLP